MKVNDSLTCAFELRGRRVGILIIHIPWKHSYLIKNILKANYMQTCPGNDYN